MQNIIEVTGLTKKFGSIYAVDNISLTVEKSDVYGFLGPNGSGKTTTIRMLCGLLTPDSGTGQCLGYDILKESTSIKKHVGYMPQYFSLYRDLSVLENLEFVARLYNVPDYSNKVEIIMKEFGLYGRRQQLAANLSGGWKQKLTLAACLVHKPKLLLLDEPTAGIDPRSRRDFWDIIYDLSKEGLTTLVTTHYMDEAQRCNKLAYISYSKLLVQGTEKHIMDSLDLKTILVTGKVTDFVAEIKGTPGVDVVPFGRCIHVNSTDEARLTNLIKPYLNNKEMKFTKIKSSIEDAFIYMVGESNV
ncbi:MAG: ABC transporter ATP-binding protein [Pseudomonadota bacterium]|nr:ABC transporter ATP-binding protein [Pseudomonadota bacterium]